MPHSLLKAPPQQAFSFRTCLWGEFFPTGAPPDPSNSAPLQLARRVHKRSLMRQSAEHVEVCVPEKTAGILPKRPEPAPCQKKALRFRVAGAFLLLVLLTSRGSTGDPAAAADHGPGPEALAVSVSETPDAVLLHIRAPGDLEPGSVEVQLAGRKTVVLARDVAGRPMRSQPLRLPEPVVEEGASADYDGDGVLVMTLRKQATAQEMAHMMPAGTSGGSPR